MLVLNYVLLRRLVLLLVICGYFLTASLSSAVGLNNEGLSLVVRALTTFLSVVLIIRSFHTQRKWLGRALIAGLSFFWFVYFLRVVYDTLLVVKPLSHDWSFYWVWGIGASAIPMFALALSKLQKDELKESFVWMYCLCFFAGVLAVLFGSTMVVSDVEVDLVDTGRFRLGGLNPILVGHLGCLLAIHSVWFFISADEKSNGMGPLLFILGFFVGVYLILVSNSRGPMVSFVFCFLFLSFFSKGRSRFFLSALMLGCVLIFAPAAYYFEENYGITTYSRIFGQSQIQEGNTQARFTSYQGAISDFLDSPLVGAGIEESGTGFYPHNVVLESFMATGIVGGAVLVLCFIAALLLAVQYYRREPYSGWIGLLYVQFLVGAQFSGSLYTSTYMWGAMGLAVALASLPSISQRLNNV